ncbi:MAG: hypothetical protein VB042_07790 [Victivallaceae bacterium]|nr:hypothetical protein [Victivallaceae bacterium]
MSEYHDVVLSSSMVLDSGDAAYNTGILTNKGRQYVNSGGYASGTVIYRWAQQIVEGGLAENTIISGGALQAVANGGIASGTVVFAEGSMRLTSGTANVVTVSSGGRLIVESGIAENVIQAAGGIVSASFSSDCMISGVNQFGSFIVSGDYASGFCIEAGGMRMYGGTLEDFHQTGGGLDLRSATLSGAEIYGGGLDTTSAIVSGAFIGGSGSVRILLGSGTDISVGSGGSLELYIGSASGVTIQSGGIMSATLDGDIRNVSCCGVMILNDRSIARDATISSGGMMIVSHCALALSGAVLEGGTLMVIAGGVCSGMVLESGTAIQYDFGTVIDVISGGKRFVADTASSFRVTTESQTVKSGFVSVSATLLSSQEVLFGGSAYATRMFGTEWAWARQNISGGMVSGCYFEVGDQFICSGGKSYDTTIVNGGQYIYSGRATGNRITGMQYVDSGCIATDNIVSGIQEVYGTASVNVIGRMGDKGLQHIGSGGLAVNTQLLESATQVVDAGGVTLGVVAACEARVLVNADGLISGALMESGSYLTVSAGGVVEALELASGAVLSCDFGARISGENLNISGNVLANMEVKGGERTVSAGDLASGFRLKYATMNVLSGGRVEQCEAIENGGALNIYSGGIAAGIYGECITIYSGGSGTDFKLDGWGKANVYGVLDGATVSEQANITVSSGGAAYNITLNDSAVIRCDFGTSATGFVGGSAFENRTSQSLNWLVSGYDSIQTVLTGQEAVHTIVRDGGRQMVYGLAADCEVSSIGVQEIGEGGLASGTLLGYGGRQIVLSGGMAIDTDVRGGGSSIEVQSGGTFGGANLVCTGTYPMLTLRSGAMVTGDILFSTANFLVESGVEFVSGTRIYADIANGSGAPSLRNNNYSVYIRIGTVHGSAFYDNFSLNVEKQMNTGVYGIARDKIDAETVNLCINRQSVADLAVDTPVDIDGVTYILASRGNSAYASPNRNGDTTNITKLVISNHETWDGWTLTSTIRDWSEIIPSTGEVFYGCTAVNTVVSGYQCALYVDKGGRSENTEVFIGSEYVNGGTARGSHIHSGAFLIVANGGTIENVQLDDGATLVAASGAALTGIELTSGQRLSATASGGHAQITVHSGAELVITSSYSSASAESYIGVSDYTESPFERAEFDDYVGYRCRTTIHGNTIDSLYNVILLHGCPDLSGNNSMLDIRTQAYISSGSVAGGIIRAGGMLMVNSANVYQSGDRVVSLENVTLEGGWVNFMHRGTHDSCGVLSMTSIKNSSGAEIIVTGADNIVASGVVRIAGTVNHFELHGGGSYFEIRNFAESGSVLNQFRLDVSSLAMMSGSVAKGMELSSYSILWGYAGCRLEDTHVGSNCGLILEEGAVVAGETFVEGFLNMHGATINSGHLVIRCAPKIGQTGSGAVVQGLGALAGSDFAIELSDESSTYQYQFTEAGAIDALTVQYNGQTYLLAVGGVFDLGAKQATLTRVDTSLVLSVTGNFDTIVGRAADGGYRLDEENFTVKSMISGAADSTAGSAISRIKFNGTTNANFYGGGYNANIGAGIEFTVYGGESCTGLIAGGSIADKKEVRIAGGINLSLYNLYQTDNVKLLKSGNSAWVVGGGVAWNNGRIDAGNVNVAINYSHVGRVVGGAQASDAGTLATADSVTITVNSSSVDSIYGGGYAYDGGTSRVSGNVEITITTGTGGCGITGGVYGGGANPRHASCGGSSTVSGDTLIKFTGKGDLLSFSGTVSGDGAVAGTVLGEKTLQFYNFFGEFNGNMKSFDSLEIAVDSHVEFSRAAEAGVLNLCLKYAVANQAGFRADFHDGFSFSGDSKSVELEIASSMKAGSYDLIGGSGLDVFDEAEFTLRNTSGEVGRMAVGDSIAYGSGTLSLIEEGGIRLVYTLA